jgi:hypothetical protein
VFEHKTTKTMKESREHPTDCASLDQLLALAQQQLPPLPAGRIRAHLDAGCEICVRRFDQMKRLGPATTRRELLDVPGWLWRQAISLFTWHRAKCRETRIKRIPGILVVDSFADGQLLGFRGARSMSRQMLYRAGDYDVDLSIDYTEQTQRVDIIGQPMPRNADLNAVAEARVTLLRESKVAHGTQTNGFGEFIIGGIQEGVYDLQIEVQGGQIDLIGLNAIFCAN